MQCFLRWQSLLDPLPEIWPSMQQVCLSNLGCHHVADDDAGGSDDDDDANDHDVDDNDDADDDEHE